MSTIYHVQRAIHYIWYMMQCLKKTTATRWSYTISLFDRTWQLHSIMLWSLTISLRGQKFRSVILQQNARETQAAPRPCLWADISKCHNSVLVKCRSLEWALWVLIQLTTYFSFLPGIHIHNPTVHMILTYITEAKLRI